MLLTQNAHVIFRKDSKILILFPMWQHRRCVSKWRMECERQEIEQRIPNTFSS